MTDKTYIPKKGDLVWIDFDPSAGSEMQKRRPGLVVSKEGFNRKTRFAVVCPITSTIRKLPTHYTLPDSLEIQGQIVISQLKSLDYAQRNAQFFERLPVEHIAHIDQVIDYIFH